jgi:hypothetical protein
VQRFAVHDHAVHVEYHRRIGSHRGAIAPGTAAPVQAGNRGPGDAEAGSSVCGPRGFGDYCAMQ